MNKFGRDLMWVGVIIVGVISVGLLTVYLSNLATEPINGKQRGILNNLLVPLSDSFDFLLA